MCKLQLRLKKSQEKSATTPQIEIKALNGPEIHQAYTEELDRRLGQIGDITLDKDERVSKLNTIIQETKKATIPARKRQHKAWISDETLEMVKIKRQL